MNPVPTTPARSGLEDGGGGSEATSRTYCVAAGPREEKLEGAALPVRRPLESFRPYRPRFTGNETSRRVEIPPRRFPPGSRARTNITSSCCLLVAG
jgi:hypothetical protein